MDHISNIDNSTGKDIKDIHSRFGELSKLSVKFLRDKKQASSTLLILTLSLGLVAGIMLVKRNQDIRNKAANDFPYNDQLLSLLDQYNLAGKRDNEESARILAEMEVVANQRK